MKKYKKYIKLLLVLIWCLTIFLFSNQKANDSTKVSSGLIKSIVEIFNKNINKQEEDKIIEEYSFIVRKTAHFTVYLILGLLIFSYLEEYNIKHIIIISLLLCFIYSVSDEYHQTFIKGRSGELRDIIIDTSGSLLGISSYYLINKKINKNKTII